MAEYYINGKSYTKKEISELTQEDFVLKNINEMPLKLYKYFPNVISKEDGCNHSVEALENNTVYLQNPIYFDDPYDSTIVIDEEEFAIQRIKYYAAWCGFSLKSDWDYSKIVYEFAVFLYRQITGGKTLEAIFGIKHDNSDKIDLIHNIFIKTFQNSLQDRIDAWQNAFFRAIHNEYVSVQESLVKKFKISCFTTTPYSMLMWSHYADSHRGFCLEYEVPSYGKRDVSLFHNLFPVIYSDERTSVLEQCIKEMNSSLITQDILWSIYKYGLLIKSMDWKYQSEWRLVSCDSMLASDDNYNCKFFNINKVYLGNKMTQQERIKIIEICKKKKIPYTGVAIQQRKYEMSDCKGLCENCIKQSISL